jgi:hypothetical protein
VGSGSHVESIKEVLWRVNLTNLGEIWELAQFEPVTERLLREQGIDLRELLESLLPKLGLMPSGEMETE